MGINFSSLTINFELAPATQLSNNPDDMILEEEHFAFVRRRLFIRVKHMARQKHQRWIDTKARNDRFQEVASPNSPQPHP